MQFSGLFIGLTTIDIQFFVDNFPGSNTKVKTSAPQIASGGPATNAAVAFSHLNNGAYLTSACGNNSFSELLKKDMEATGIKHIDMVPSQRCNPVFASVITSLDNGYRSIISHTPDRVCVEIDAEQLFTNVNPHFVLLDGFYPEAAIPLAQIAKQNKVPVILDCGSWKPQFDELLPLTDIAICSEDFYPPDCTNVTNVFAFLKSKKIARAAITRGEKNIMFYDLEQHGEIQVNPVKAVDTLGAGDFMHGAFCYFYLKENFNFQSALKLSAGFATKTCLFKGTRMWL